MAFLGALCGDRRIVRQSGATLTDYLDFARDVVGMNDWRTENA